MSTQSTLVTAEHFRYLAERTLKEDAFLSDLRRAAGEASLPAIHIAPEQASFLQILLRLHRAREGAGAAYVTDTMPLVRKRGSS